MSFFQLHYTSDPSQLEFLQLLSDRAHQRITYHCKNSIPWPNEASSDVIKSVKMLTINGLELHAKSSNKFKPRLVTNDCVVKSHPSVSFFPFIHSFIHSFIYSLVSLSFLKIKPNEFNNIFWNIHTSFVTRTQGAFSQHWSRGLFIGLLPLAGLQLQASVHSGF